MPKNKINSRNKDRALPFKRLDLSTPQTDEEARESDEWWHYSLGLRILVALDGLDAIRERNLQNPQADTADEQDVAAARKTLALYALVLYASRFGVSRWS